MERRGELAKKVSAEDELFAEAGGEAEHDPENDLSGIARSQRGERFLRDREMGEAQQAGDDGENEKRREPEDAGSAEVAGQRTTAEAEDGREAHVAQAQSPP